MSDALISDPDIFDIDECRLDELWAEQPGLVRKYVALLAASRMEHEKAKAAKEFVVAELDQKIRLHPDDFGLAKVTETALERTIVLQKPYQVATERVIQAKYRMDDLQGVVDALEHRKKAIEGRVQLWSMDYFSEPRESISGGRKMGDSKKKTTRKRGQERA